MSQRATTTAFTETTNYGAQVGHNHGTITYNLHTPHANPSLPPLLLTPPSATIPFRRDRDFVERDVLNDLWRRASEPAARVALVGLGGIGKTQLAIEYAYRLQEANAKRWVFWVHASSAARFEESYKTIAERVRLVGRDEPKADILGMVYRWLSDESHGRWTMMVDNADSAEVMFETGYRGNSSPSLPTSTSLMGHSLSDYLPSSVNGAIVITSRNRKVAEGLIEYEDDILEVGPMNEGTAVTLLQKKLKKSDSRSQGPGELVRLVQQLDYMPLAITQAAAYINQRAPRASVSKYLDTLDRADNDRAQLLQIDIRDPRRDGQASSSIMTTWSISFEYIRQTRDSAARLLALMSLFDREAIPDHLLRGRYIEDQEGREIDFEEDIATLRAYHLIGTGMNDDLFDMHRLVQFSTKQWLELHGELEWWQIRYIYILGEMFPSGDYVNWRTCQALYPHVASMVAYRVNGTECLRVWATVVYRGSWYAWASGQYGVAEKMARASLQVREEIYGVDNEETLNGVEMLALVLQYQGKYEEAESMSRRAVAGSEKVLGVEHPDTLTSVSNLAQVLRYQGKYEEAELMSQQALAGSEKVLGVEHPNTLTSASILALVLQHQGKYEEAELMNRQALAGREKVLGAEHPDTLTTTSNLALVLQYQGKYEESELMNRRALAGSEKVLGVEHPSTLTSMNNLIRVLQRQGKDKEAESMNRQVLAGREKVLGAEHPSTLVSVGNLAWVLQYQGKYEEAELMSRQALAGSEKVLGVEHPSTLICMGNLAQVLQRQEKYKEAESMSRRALAGSEKVLGAEHPETLASVYCLAYLLDTRQDFNEASELYQRAVTGYSKVLGEHHPTTRACQEHLSSLLEKMRPLPPNLT